MGMQLPGWLRQALEYVGYDWPASDESVLAEWGGQWSALAATAQEAATLINEGVQRVSEENQGPAADAFAAYMQDGNAQSLQEFAAASGAAGAAHQVVAGIVLTMKLAVIAQLVILAAAIAAAVASGGLASGGVVVARQAAKWAIEAAINIAIEQILGV